MDVEKYNLEDEMKANPAVISYLKDRDIAVQFYGALCNMQWQKIIIIPDDERIINRLKGIEEELWHCSWRHAGGIIAEIRDKHYNTDENYMDFYCSGNEATITNLVRDCFEKMGWKPRPYDEEEEE